MCFSLLSQLLFPYVFQQLRCHFLWETVPYPQNGRTFSHCILCTAVTCSSIRLPLAAHQTVSTLQAGLCFLQFLIEDRHLLSSNQHLQNWIVLVPTVPPSCGFPTLKLLSPWWMPPNNSLPFGFLSRICCILNLRLHPDSWFALSRPLLSPRFQPIFKLTWLSDASSDDYPLTSANICEIELYQYPQHLRKQVSSPEPLASLSKPLKTTGDWPSGPWFPGSFYCPHPYLSA